jgi:hypothetical protein
MHKPLPGAAYLRECFDYNPETGAFVWRARPRHHFESDRRWRQANTRSAGKIAGTPNKFGHIWTGLGDGRFYVHRIIWKMMTGEEPPELDHHNRKPFDNRWSNLRIATRRNNTQNKTVRSDAASGLKGVRPDKRSGRYGAEICIGGNKRWLGTFESKEAAHAAYCAAAREAFGQFFCDGQPD